MARKFWTLLPETYYSSKQLAKGGRNEIIFTAIGNSILTKAASSIIYLTDPSTRSPRLHLIISNRS